MFDAYINRNNDEIEEITSTINEIHEKIKNINLDNISQMGATVAKLNLCMNNLGNTKYELDNLLCQIKENKISVNKIDQAKIIENQKINDTINKFLPFILFYSTINNS
jgi:hypothetical protein